MRERNDFPVKKRCFVDFLKFFRGFLSERGGVL